MTEKLKTLMDEVTEMVDPDFRAPDLDAIVRDGDRSVRRRRATVALAGAAAAAVAVAMGVGLTGGGGGGDVQVADTPVDAVGMSWAIGTEIRTPTASVDTGHAVRAYVRTTVGYVAVDDSGRVRSIVGDEATQIGRVTPSSLFLVSDAEDTLAAWLEPAGQDTWQWVVYDQRTSSRVATHPAGTGPEVPGAVVALDDGDLYVKDSGYARIDADGETAASAISPPARGAQLLAVEDSVLAWADNGGADGESAYVVERAETERVRIPAVEGYVSAISPDTRWIAFDADEPRVFDARTGAQIEIDVDGRVFAAAYDWLDEDSLAVIASRDETGPAELLVCEVPDGSCAQVEDDLGTFDGLVDAGFALPTGESIDD